jgi:hypothetical protein
MWIIRYRREALDQLSGLKAQFHPQKSRATESLHLSFLICTYEPAIVASESDRIRFDTYKIGEVVRRSIQSHSDTTSSSRHWWALYLDGEVSFSRASLNAGSTGRQLSVSGGVL